MRAVRAIRQMVSLTIATESACAIFEFIVRSNLPAVIAVDALHSDM
jgi:hypothetical protein